MQQKVIVSATTSVEISTSPYRVGGEIQILKSTSYQLCQLLDCVPSPFPCMPIFDDWGLLGFKTFYDVGFNGLRFDSI
jgi:hypothetical protein